MSMDGDQLRNLLRGILLGASLLAGNALTWSTARFGFAMAFQPTYRQSKVSARLRVKAARDASAQYMMDNASSCPRDIDQLVSQKYLDRSNAKDSWGKDLIFHCPAASSDISEADVSSAGPDEQVGTPDDINSWDL